MKRPLTRILFVVLLVVSAFAGWAWLRPYAWSPDPGARFRIEQAQLRHDHEEYWLDIMLKQSGPEGHDFTKPLALETVAGRRVDPVDITGAMEEGKTDGGLWLKFILQEEDLKGPLKLVLNDGLLIVKAQEGVPAIPSGASKVYLSNHW